MDQRVIDRVFERCTANRERDLADLFRLLRQPSISTQGIGVAECANLVEELLNAAGLAARQLPTAGYLMVYAKFRPIPGVPRCSLRRAPVCRAPPPRDDQGQPSIRQYLGYR